MKSNALATYHGLVIECLLVYQAAYTTGPLVDEAGPILSKIDGLLQAAGVAYLQAGVFLDLSGLPDYVQAPTAEQIATAYRDVQLRFEDLKATVYEFSSSLLGNEHTCEQGAALIDALVHIAPDYRDSKTLQQFARSFCPAFVAFEQGEWETARKGFATALKITPRHARATGLHRASHMIPAQDAIGKEQWGAATGLLNAWLTIAPNDDEAQQLLRQSRLGLANAAIEGGKWRDAQHLLAEWLRSHPDDEEAFTLQRSSYVKPAEAAIATEQWDVARTHLDAWIKILPIDGEAKNLIAEIHYRQCSCLLERGSLWQAAETYQRVSNSDRLYADRLADLPRQYPGLAWYVRIPSTLRVLIGHSGPVNCVEWDPNGRRLASASSDATVKIWDATTGQLLQTLTGHGKEVYSVTWSANGQWLASGGADGTVRIWDVATWRLVERLEGQMPAVRCVAWSPNDTHLAWCGHGSAIKICRLEGERNVMTLVEPPPADLSVLQLLQAWPEQPQEQPQQYWSVVSVAWSPDGTQLVSGGLDGLLRIWDTRTARCFQKILTATHEHERTDSSRLLTNAITSVMAQASQTQTEILKLRHKLHDPYDSLGDELSRSLEKLRAKQMRFETHASLRWDLLDFFNMTYVGSGSDGLSVVSGSAFGWIKTWDTYSGRLLRTVVMDRNPVVDVASTPDGVRMALASPDRSVTVLDAETGRVIQCLLGHTDGVSSVAWNPDASRLASASSDGTVRIWGCP